MSDAPSDELVEALRPFAKLAENECLTPDLADEYMSLNVALMNGNVVQCVIHDALKVGDLRRARDALTAYQKATGGDPRGEASSPPSPLRNETIENEE